MLIGFTVFSLGLLVGSFLNVVIYRLPMGRSILFPPSHCMLCNKPLTWYELIPIISFVMQKGQCRSCRNPISVQYPIIELITGVIYLLLYFRYGIGYQYLISVIFSSVLIPIIIIDLKYQIIPDLLNISGAVFGLSSLLISDISFTNALSGGLAGGAIMLLIAIVSRGGMGGGDVKMVAMMGLFLGWRLTLLALFLSFVIGGLGSLLLILFGIKKRKDFIPFGPFLAIGGFTAYVFGTEILTWYFKAFIG